MNINFQVKNHVAWVIIDRPEALNALNFDTLQELATAVERVAADEDIHVLVIGGAGRAFVAGADIGEMRDFCTEEARRFGKLGQRLFERIASLCKPSIAMLNGVALGGGCELALACDIRLAHEKVKIGQPEINLGIIPGFGGMKRLADTVGLSKAKQLLFTGEALSAAEAKAIGLINEVYAIDELEEKTREMAEMLAQKPQLALRYAKLAINGAYQKDMATAEQIESTMFAMCFATEDQKEGMSAFLEKRTPNFTSGKGGKTQ